MYNSYLIYFFLSFFFFFSSSYLRKKKCNDAYFFETYSGPVKLSALLELLRMRLDSCKVDT